MQDFLNPESGEEFDVEIVISSLGVKLTQYDKLAIALLPNDKFTGDVVLVTPEDMSRMARLVGSPDRFTLANAVNGANDQSTLSMTMKWCVKDQPIGTDKDCNAIVSNAGSTVFLKSFWDTGDMEIIPSIDAQTSINRLNDKVDLAYALKQRDASQLEDTQAKVRRSKKSLKRANKTVNLEIDETVDAAKIV